MRCNCKSAPQYHRDDCPDFDSHGNLKYNSSIFFISETLNPHRLNPSPTYQDSVTYFDNSKIANMLISILDELNLREKSLNSKYPPKLKPIILAIDNSKSILDNHQGKLSEILKKARKYNITVIIKT